jgi:predicted acylesterase/phospholipase RssA
MARESGKLQCDLVMRGGITSGIVYPRAIAKLAETYDFRSIGGTSAGAIAAAGTAAAAFGAKHGQDHFQTRLKDLPKELAEQKDGKTVLERLFQPQESTAALFNVLMAGLGRDSRLSKIGRVTFALCRNYPLYALLGAVVALSPLLATHLSGPLFLLALVPAALFIVACPAVGALRDLLGTLPENGYGLCGGSRDMKPDEAGVLPLTDWLHQFFQDVANRPLDHPVTFGDLWGNNGDMNAPRDIQLVLMTTNITRGISQRFPFLEGSWGQLYFDETELAALFPAPIVTWMKRHAADPRHRDKVHVPKGFHPIPAPPDLPILLGARMSLSFPFLLSAVPLHAANFERAPENGKFPLQRCWFSDGGLTSNFPIHFFDAPIPRWPTFGINLMPDTVETMEIHETDESLERVSGIGAEAEPRIRAQGEGWDKVWMPSTNSTGISSAARFNMFKDLGGFFNALFDTARNWADTELMATPGYRDRIVHVKLAENEGGLNLNMPPALITKLGVRGERAGELLAGRFAPTPTGHDEIKDPQSGDDVVLTWDNHRWIRYRTFMAGLELVARRFRATWKDAAGQKPWRSYDGLLRRGAQDLPKSYPLHRPGQQGFAESVTGEVVTFVDGWTTDDETFDREQNPGRSPRPKPVLRMVPSGSNDPRDERADPPEDAPPIV